MGRSMASRQRPVTNLAVLAKAKRPRPRPGDIFALRLMDLPYMFGRVVSRSARIGPMTDVIMCYVYNAQAATQTPPRSELRPDRLLLPPILTNDLPWTKGYFNVVETDELRPDELLPVHCFFDRLRNRFVDEQGTQLDSRREPCGRFALQSYRTIDDDLSDALGIPRAPEDDRVRP